MVELAIAAALVAWVSWLNYRIRALEIQTEKALTEVRANS